MQHYSSVILIVFQMMFSFTFGQQKDVFLCYGKVPIHNIFDYKYVIVDASNYTVSEVDVLKQRNTHVLAYISLGEMNKTNTYYYAAKIYTLEGKNNNWDSYYLDLSKEGLREILLDDIKSKIIDKGFNGLFLDNIDNFGEYGKQKDLLPELLEFIQLIKATFPNIHLMQNAGLGIVPSTRPYINSVAIESVFTNYNFDEKRYSIRKYKEIQKRLEPLLEVRERFNIPVILIEYTDRKRGKRKIKRKSRKYNFLTFIGQIDLLKLPIFK